MRSCDPEAVYLPAFRHFYDGNVECYDGIYLPVSLGYWTFLATCNELLKYGHYEPKPVTDYPLLLWDTDTPIRFVLDRIIPVRCSLSIELGMKSRLTTMAPAAFMQIGSYVRHICTNLLLNDRTLRIGFQTSYKLWELLKSLKGDFSWIHACDLDEATYRMSHDLLKAIYYRLKVTVRFPLFRLFEDLLTSYTRLVEADNLSEYRIPKSWIAKSGSFMGESLSFIYLTLIVRAVSYIASCYYTFNIKHNTSYWFPDNCDIIIRRGVETGHEQVLGDDHIAFDQSRLLALHRRWIYKEIKLVVSVSKDGISQDFAVFCENALCIPSDKDVLTDKEGETFGKIVYIDTIKSRLLSGTSKVSMEHRSPIFGHASALERALKWIKDPETNRRVETLFWVVNYHKAVKLGGCYASLPQELGGFGLPRFTPSGEFRDLDNDPKIRIALSYLEAIYRLNDSQFMVYWLLLRSINSERPKGNPFIMTPKETLLISSKFNWIVPNWDIEPWCSIPAYIKADRNALHIWMEIKHGLISARTAFFYINRIKAISSLMRGEHSPAPNVYDIRQAKARFMEVWSIIRDEITPCSPTKSVSDLADLYVDRTTGRYLDSSSPMFFAILGAPNLTFRSRFTLNPGHIQRMW
jgi:hypothetical protein